MSIDAQTGRHNPEADRWRQLQIDWSGRQQLLRRWLTDDTHVKHLLRVLFDHTPAGETDCWLLIGTIAREMSCSVRTVQRAIREAEREGFLIVFGPRGKRRCNTYRLRLANIYDCARAELKGDYLTPQGCQPDTPRVTSCHPRGDYLTPRSRKEVPKEPPPPESAVTAAHPADEWAVVVAEMLDYGVQDPLPAVEAARRRGCSAPYVRRVIEYARAQTAADGTRAWGGGALRRRVANLLPGQPIDDPALWLPPAPEYLAARRREAERAEAERRRRERDTHPAEADPLEAEYGARLDALPLDERLALVDEAFAGDDRRRSRSLLRRVILSGRPIAFGRPAMLRALARRQEAQR